MPNFNYGPNYLAGYQSSFQPITAFQQGRANKLAYETELQQQEEREQDIAAKEYANRPDVRAAELANMRAATEQMEAQAEVMRRPAPYEPPDYIKGAENYWEPPRFPGDKPRRTDIPVPKSGTDVTVNMPGQPTKSRLNKLQETQDVTAAGFGRLQRIRQAYDPVYSTLPGRVRGGWAEIRSKAGLNLSEADQAYLQDYTDWQTRTINNLNDHIRAITGAQLSEQEAKRIMQGMPNLEDGPVKFIQKLDTIMEELALSNARANWVMKNGYSEAVLSSTTLDAMDGIIEQWAQQQERMLIEQGLTKEQAEAEVLEATYNEWFR